MLTIVFKYNSCILADVITIYSVFDELILGFEIVNAVMLAPISRRTLKATPAAYFKYF